MRSFGYVESAQLDIFADEATRGVSNGEQAKGLANHRFDVTQLA